MKTKIPKIVITRMSPRWSYFQFFLLGLYELEKKNKIILKFKCDIIFKLSTFFPDTKIVRGIVKVLNSIFNKDSYNMEGFIEVNNAKKYFCIDSADSPFLFDSTALNMVDIYFKMQCPKEFQKEGFKLTDSITIPWCDHQHEDERITKLTARGPRKPLLNLQTNINKIRPLVVGFRRLASFNSYSSLKKGYEHYRNNITNSATKRMMCYFGNAQGPRPEKNITKPDWDWEGDIMGTYAQKIEHPNVKRAKISQLIKAKGPSFDARIISDHFSDEKKLKRENLIVPIENFCTFISQFEYNINISGYRMSIPNRFIESFIAGTAIFTDKLAVKWYRPFDDEVVETVQMGYLKDSEIDWNAVEKDINNLPDISKEHILKLFNKKWAPIKVAEYIVSSLVETFN